MVFLDIAAFLVSTYLAFYLRLGVWATFWPFIGIFSATGLALGVSILWYCGVYQAIFRFVGAGMMATLFRAYILYTVVMLAIFGIWGVPGVPRTISVIQPLLYFVLIVGLRTTAGFLLLEVQNRTGLISSVKFALIYGAGTNGQQLARSLKAEKSLRIVGYLDDDARLAGQKLDRDPIFDAEKLGDVVKRTGATMVLLALPELSRSRRQQIVDRLSDFEVEVRAVPNMADLVGGTVTIDDIRPIEIEDLLGRASVKPNEVLLAKNLFGKVVLVTGAGGSIGGELCRQIAAVRPKTLILADMSEHALYLINRELTETRDSLAREFEIIPEIVNVSDRASVARMFERWKPHTVLHAAAYKHVPLVERNLIEGLKNNVLGTLNCADAALAAGTSHFILISSDKAVRPTNVMGASKRICELVLQGLAAESTSTRFAMVRFGNVLGSSGSVVPQFLSQIREGGPVTLTHRDITRYFMTIPEAAQLVIQAGAMAQGGEVYLLDMGEPIRIYDMASKMIRLSGLSLRDDANPEGDIQIIEVGLRPGEKLYEELLIDADSLPTHHPRIKMAKERMIPIDELRQQIDSLTEAFKLGDRGAALGIMRQLVPEYHSGQDATHEPIETTLQ